MCNRFLKKLAIAAFGVASLYVSVFAVGRDDRIVWRPVTPEEMQMKTPKVDPDADAEAIFWEVRLDDRKVTKLSYSHYVRVKIFTERGRERFSKMDIPFMKNRKVENVAARVIKPDGTIVELNTADIFEREIARAGKAKVMAKSFAVPGIEPGVIVEYQYSETIKNDSAGGERLIFQRDVPLQKVSYYIRPQRGFTLSVNAYNMPETRFVEDKDGFSVGTMYNVPAFKEEPYMPPDDEVRKWVYLSYRAGTLFQWGDVALAWSEILKKLSKPNKEVKLKAAELTAGALSDEEKIRLIYSFVQRDIKNISFDRAVTEEQIEKLDIEDVDDTLKKRMGRSFQIDMLFASLARAAGFETRVFLAPDRNEYFFDVNKYPFPNFIEMSGIAVKIGGQWRFFNPCTPYLPFGSLAWNRESVSAMMIGDGGFTWQTIPLSGHDKSPAKRTGKFTLSADGTLEGTVKLEYLGHQAISRRGDHFRSSQAERMESIKKELEGRISTAEISNIGIENFDDNTKPLTFSYKVRVPGYAQKAGKRLILQPGFFEHGSASVFTSATRTYSIYFPYPWSEEDKIEIKLPDGYALDSPDAPGELFDPQKIGRLRVGMRIDKAANVLYYDRSFHFGGGGNTLFPVNAYKALKGLFDSFHRADMHAVSLKTVN